MKKLNTFTGGHNLSTDDAQWMQSAYLESLSNFVLAMLPDGVDKCILHGIVVNKSGDDYTHTAGAIYYDGEVYAVDALSAPLTDAGTPKFAITSSVGDYNPVQYENGDTHNVHVNEKMRLVLNSDGSGLFDYNTIKRVEHLMHSKIESPGSTKFFTGDPSTHFNLNGLGVSDEWLGWALLDGQGGRLNLKGRTVVGYDGSEEDYDTVGNVGGAKEVTLTSAQSGLPDHNHNQEPSAGVGGSGITAGTPGGVFNGTKTGVVSGGAQDAQEPHENRPPYLVLAPVVKL